jgi:trigger factor
LKLEKPTRSFTSKDVDRHLEKLVRGQARLVPYNGPAELEDFVVVNMTFRHQGKVVSECQEQTIRVAPLLSFPDGNLEGFGKLISGARAGDDRTATITVSHDAANEEICGQDVNVEIEVLEVKRRELPELDPGLLRRLGHFESEGELRDAIVDELDRRLGYHQQRHIRQQITALLTESASWELPPELLRRQARRELDRAVLELRSSGFGDEEIRAHENELRQNSLASTERALKEHFILERIAEDQDITDEPADYDLEIQMIAAQSGENPRRVRARLEKEDMMDTLRNQIVERKVVGLIESEAEFNEVPYKPEETETEAVEHFIAGEPKEEIPAAKYDEEEALRQPAERG